MMYKIHNKNEALANEMNVQLQTLLTFKPYGIFSCSFDCCT